jgi:hypothetical protein
MRRFLALSLSLAMTGCPTSEDPPPPDETPDPAAIDPTCSPEITAPAGPTGVATHAPTAHEEVYGLEPAPFQVRYQWPSRRPDRSAGFLWRTDVDTLASVVEWGEGAALDHRVEGSSLLYGDSDSFAGYRIHEVRLCGALEPATTYSYRVGGDGGWSQTWTFTTPAAPGGSDTLTVAIAGDSRGAYTTWASLLASMEAHDPDVFLFSGDMVQLGVRQSEWDDWFGAAGDLWTRRVLLPAHGNHELFATNYFAQFALPGNEEWYSVDIGPLHVVSLNDTVRELYDIEVEERMFLEEDLASSDAAWTFVEHHQAMYSSSTVHGSYEELRAAWGPAFDAGGVDVVFAGHNHLYERTVPIRGDQADETGATYIVSGGAGAPLYSGTTETWFTALAEPIEHYIIAEIAGNTAEFTVRDLDDNVIDQFTITR